MIRTTSIIAFTSLLLAVGGCTSTEPASADSAANQDQKGVAIGAMSSSANRRGADEMVTLDRCPAAVQATIMAHMNGGTITQLERTTDHGEVLYEVDVRTAGGVVEFDVAEDGAFRGFENDGDDGASEADDAGSDHDGGSADPDDGSNEPDDASSEADDDSGEDHAAG